MENNLLMKDFVIYNGKKCILSTAALPGDTPVYETLLMRKDYTEIDCRKTENKEAAIRLHIASAEKLRNKMKRADGAAVGMLFVSSWGYEQTNITFFQIVELLGAASVRVREVYPELTAADAISWGAENVRYKNERMILPPAENSVFIDDCAAGDIKRIKKDADGLTFLVSDYARAYEYHGEELYRSWYY